MRQSEDILAEREMGQYPVSIGTSLALEGLTAFTRSVRKAHPRCYSTIACG